MNRRVFRMSNWVYNKMSVYGKKQKLNAFKVHVAGKKRSGFSFENIILKPNDTSLWRKRSIPGWVNWGYKHWGTKWEPWDIELLIKEKCLLYKFTTANSPPFPIYDKLIETFPQLTFDLVSYDAYDEWAYELEAKNGGYTKIVEETMEPFSMDTLEWDNLTVVKMLCARKDLLNNRIHVSIEDVVWGRCTKGAAVSASENIESDIYKGIEDEDDYNLLQEFDSL
jgi:hypothetical protein